MISAANNKNILHHVLIVAAVILVVCAGVTTGETKEAGIRDHLGGSLRGKASSVHRQLAEGAKIHKIIQSALDVASGATDFAGKVTKFCGENAARDEAIEEFCDEVY